MHLEYEFFFSLLIYSNLQVLITDQSTSQTITLHTFNKTYSFKLSQRDADNLNFQRNSHRRPVAPTAASWNPKQNAQSSSGCSRKEEIRESNKASQSEPVAQDGSSSIIRMRRALMTLKSTTRATTLQEYPANTTLYERSSSNVQKPRLPRQNGEPVSTWELIWFTRIIITQTLCKLLAWVISRIWKMEGVVQKWVLDSLVNLKSIRK